LPTLEELETARPTGVKGTLKVYYKVTKPNLWSLLVYTGFVGALVASRTLGYIPWDRLAIVTAALLAGTAGANTVTSYIDRDIDGVMRRTCGRPIPAGWITPPEKALYYGSTLIVLAHLLAFWAHPLSALMMALGVFDNVIIYSILTKRKTPWNIIVGGISGGMPTLVGYTGIAGRLDYVPIIMALLVILWIPSHIWSLALRYREDYARAQVPMLPVVVSERVTVWIITATSLLVAGFSLTPPMTSTFGFLYLLFAAPMGAVMLGLSLWLFWNPTGKRAWVLFKFTSPYLAILFTVMMAVSLT
jgi:protoheme IX farnesyltransferase